MPSRITLDMQLASAFKNSPNFVTVTRRADGRFVDVNPAFERVTGWKRSEVIGRTPVEINLWKYPDQREDLLLRIKHEGVLSNEPTSFLTRDGQPCDGFISVDVVQENGEEYLVSIIRDIGAHDELKAAVRRAEERYRAIVENAHEGFYQCSPEGRLLSANPAMARLLGFDSSAQLLQEAHDIGKQFYVDPEVRREVLARTEAEGRITGLEFELRRRDGTRIWVRENARTVRDDQGGLRYFEGSLEDVTARKQAEYNLRLLEERYQTLVDQSQDGIFVTYNGRYLFVNEAFARMLDYRREQLIDMDCMRIVAAEDRKEQIKRYEQRQTGSRQLHAFEICYLKRDGCTRVLASVRDTPIDYGGIVARLGTVRDITEERRWQRQLAYNATHDPLTGLANRTLFSERLVKTLERASRDSNYHYAVFFLDLDGFKVVNDSLGHEVGDRMLVEISRRLEGALADDIVLARHGGDEFTILLDGFHKPAEVDGLAQRLLDQFNTSFRVGANELFSSASVGVVRDHPNYRSTDTVLRDADTAMYQAKARGAAAYVIFDESMHIQVKNRLALETELRLALERQEFVVHYQPIINLTEGRVAGVEALVRWQHPDRGLLLPGEFLGVAEEIGLVLPLDWWVMESACRQLTRWKSQHPQLAHLKLHVNLDDRQFHHTALTRTLRRLLAQTDMEPDRLHLEITERIFRDQVTSLKATLSRLVELGVHLHVDDFGTGYSSLDSLSNLQFDGLKIDASFIRDLDTNTRHQAIVKTILQFAADLKMDAVAEGVESVAQAETLKQFQCQEVQGHLFAPALNAENTKKLLLSSRPFAGSVAPEGAEGDRPPAGAR